MDCLEFRRAASADPRRMGAAATAHAAQCAACREFHARTIRFDRRLHRSLRAPVPPGLAHRLLGHIASRRRVRWYAFAALLLLAAGLAASIALAPDDPLARAGIDFVVHDEARTIIEAEPADADIVGRVAREMRVSLGAQLGEVRYICRYPFAAGAAHHLLVTTPLGKATVLLFPGAARASRGTASASGLQAAAIPVPGGTAAIVADSARGVARLEALLAPI